MIVGRRVAMLGAVTTPRRMAFQRPPWSALSRLYPWACHLDFYLARVAEMSQRRQALQMGTRLITVPIVDGCLSRIGCMCMPANHLAIILKTLQPFVCQWHFYIVPRDARR
jgi:hypothetical protein